MDYLLILHLQILYYPWYYPWIFLKAKRYIKHCLSSCNGAIFLNVFIWYFWWHDFGAGTWSEAIWCMYDIAGTWSKRGQNSMTSYIISPLEGIFNDFWTKGMV